MMLPPQCSTEGVFLELVVPFVALRLIYTLKLGRLHRCCGEPRPFRRNAAASLPNSR